MCFGWVTSRLENPENLHVNRYITVIHPFNVAMTSSLECGLLTPLQPTVLPLLTYRDQCIIHSSASAMWEKWRNTSEISLLQKRTKWFWKWIHYVWLHLDSSQKRVKDYCDFVEFEYQKLVTPSVTRWLYLSPSLPRMLQMYPSSHSWLMSIKKSTYVLKRFFGNFLSELCWRH